MKIQILFLFWIGWSFVGYSAESAAKANRPYRQMSQIRAFVTDIDDNLFFTPAKIMLWDTKNKKEVGVSTKDFAIIQELMAKKVEPWGHFEFTPQSFRYFGDDSEEGPDLFKKQITEMIESPPSQWQAPSFPAFQQAMEHPELREWFFTNSARRHSRTALAAGFQVLKDAGYIKESPIPEHLFAVGAADFPKELLGKGTPESKANVQRMILDKMEKIPVPKDALPVDSRDGKGPKVPLHLWGFSDDDYKNIEGALRLVGKDAKLWPHVKMVFFFDGTNNPDHKPESMVIRLDGTPRPATPQEATHMIGYAFDPKTPLELYLKYCGK